MLALDTNILVRFFTKDDPEQAVRAHRLISKALDSGEPIYISDIVLCELVWVLKVTYHCSRRTIFKQLKTLILLPEVCFRNKNTIQAALLYYINNRGDFADYLLREHAREAGCRTIATFDKALLGETGFSEPE